MSFAQKPEMDVTDVRQRPVKRATIAMEEGSSLDNQETAISSGGSGSANDEEKEIGRRSLARDGTDRSGGLGGPAMGPPRRSTMNTDPAEGRNLVR